MGSACNTQIHWKVICEPGSQNIWSLFLFSDYICMSSAGLKFLQTVVKFFFSEESPKFTTEAMLYKANTIALKFIRLKVKNVFLNDLFTCWIMNLVSMGRRSLCVTAKLILFKSGGPGLAQVSCKSCSASKISNLGALGEIQKCIFHSYTFL